MRRCRRPAAVWAPLGVAACLAAPEAAAQAPIVGGSYGANFDALISQSDSGSARRLALAEYFRIGVQGPIVSWPVFNYALTADLRNHDDFGLDGHAGTLVLDANGRLSAWANGPVPAQVWGGLGSTWWRGKSAALGQAVNANVGGEVMLRPAKNLPQVRVTGSVAEGRMGESVEDPVTRALRYSFGVDATESVGLLQAGGGWSRSGVVDRIGGQSSVGDAWTAHGAMRAHRTVDVSLAATGARQVLRDADGVVSSWGAADVDTRLRWRPRQDMWTSTYYLYHRDGTEAGRQTIHTVGADASARLRDGVWAGSTVTFAGALEGEGADATETEKYLSEDQVFRIEAYRSSPRVQGRVSGSAGWGYGRSVGAPAGVRGGAGLRGGLSLFPLRFLALFGDLSWDLRSDVANPASDGQQIGTSIGLATRGSKVTVADAIWRYSLGLPRGGGDPNQRHEVEVRANVVGGRVARGTFLFSLDSLSAEDELWWRLGTGVNGSLRLGQFLGVALAAQVTSFRPELLPPRDDLGLSVSVQLRLRRWTLATSLRSRFELGGNSLADHVLGINLNHDFGLP